MAAARADLSGESIGLSQPDPSTATVRPSTVREDNYATTQLTLSSPLAREDVDIILVNNDYRPVDVISLLRYQPLSPPVNWSVSPAR